MYFIGAEFAGACPASLNCDSLLERRVAEDVGATGLPLAFSLNDSGSVKGDSVGLSGPEPELNESVDSRPSCPPGAGSLG